MTVAQHSPTRSESATAPRYLNLGCGTRYHAAWINVDLHPAAPDVRRHDVSERLPFAAAHFDAVYSSHLLEHLRPERVPAFLGECRRVLRPGGVLRLAVPDLETIARHYLAALDAASERDIPAAERHRWFVLEMFDQVAREHSGGAMLEYLRGAADEIAWFRLGADGQVLRAHIERVAPAAAPPGWRARLRGWLFGSWRERLIRRLLGREYELLQVGRFRRGGEVHHAMYDRVSLRSLLEAAGFVGFRCTEAHESVVPGWVGFGLDVDASGAATKPDSLYVEARSP